MTLFLSASQGITRVKESQSSQSAGGTCEMLRGGLQDFPSPSTSRRALLKKKGKSKRQGQYKSRSNTLHVGAAVSYCAVQFTGKADQPRFNVLSSNAVKTKS